MQLLHLAADSWMEAVGGQRGGETERRQETKSRERGQTEGRERGRERQREGKTQWVSLANKLKKNTQRKKHQNHKLL